MRMKNVCVCNIIILLYSMTILDIVTFKLFETSKEIEEDEGQTSTDQNGKDVKIKTEMPPPKTAPRQNDFKHNKSTPSL